MEGVGDGCYSAGDREKIVSRFFFPKATASGFPTVPARTTRDVCGESYSRVFRPGPPKQYKFKDKKNISFVCFDLSKQNRGNQTGR